MSKSNVKFITNHNKSVIVHVCFVLWILCFCICVCQCLFQNNNHQTKHKNDTNCGSAFEPGASGLPYYCASICVCPCCDWRANSVDSKIYMYIYFWIPKYICIYIYLSISLSHTHTNPHLHNPFHKLRIHESLMWHNEILKIKDMHPRTRLHTAGGLNRTNPEKRKGKKRGKMKESKRITMAYIL